jgi:hypothetical protein
MTLVECEGVAKKDRALDHEVSTIPPDTTVYNESKDLCV